ncbi:MAG TPA: 3-hydroxyacyl-CoA dehydrogenase NAD-binding domain-containing protein [Gemmatimonadales bacterium]|nr:3-hydroxyacyl-CoA dehydrogenase NAD-binding domain-containing protein [Gemmatimonadales bacterium]
MPALTRDTTIGVLGAGAMGSGIAQVAAAAGHRVMVTDARADVLEQAADRLAKTLARLVEKGRMDAPESAGLLERITWAPGAAGEFALFRHCGLVLEAIAEDLRIKQQAFYGLESVVGDGCILATNTSSLSVTGIAGACRRPERVLGLHFFNPAPLLPLVEVVPGLRTAPETTAIAKGTMGLWGKTAVLAADTPGFIVNRIARPFYGEALRIFEEGIADKATIDWAMKEIGGFRMGPFELMDLIGNDVNLAVTHAIFAAFSYDPRYRPSLTQQRLVEANRLGWKTGQGHYEYTDQAVMPPPVRDPVLGRAVVDRILAMLINAAVDAVFWQVAGVDDIELSMTKGVSYPKGLLHWGDEIGLAAVLARLVALQEEYGEDRYRPSPLLRRMAREGTRFFP